MSTKETPKLRSTRDYSLFVHSRENRPVNMEKHRKLERSMQEYGYLPMYPIHVRRLANGKHEIVDGQHRFAFAHKLGLPVWFVSGDENINVAMLNNTQEKWVMKDYAMCFAEMGKKDYQEVLEFSQQYGIPPGDSAGLLAGTVSWTNIRDAYTSGSYRVKTREKAHRIASVYMAMVSLNKHVRNTRLLKAIYAVCHVDGFDPARMIHNVKKCPEKLMAYSNRDAYLTMLEDIYNFARHKREALKIPAENAMRERSAV